MLSHFTVIRKIEGAIFPMGFTKEAAERNIKAGFNVISCESRHVLIYLCLLLSINHFLFKLSFLGNLTISFCFYFYVQYFSERALLNRLMIELHKLDSDVLVGHNISGFDLDVLLHRFQVLVIHLSFHVYWLLPIV